MKLKPDLLEWFFVLGLVLITIMEYLLVAGGLSSARPEASLTNIILLLVVAGELVIGILLVRIYAKMR